MMPLETSHPCRPQPFLNNQGHQEVKKGLPTMPSRIKSKQKIKVSNKTNKLKSNE